MANESLQTCALDKDHREEIVLMLLDAIAAKSELDRTIQNIKDAAKSGYPAKFLTAECIMPRSVDLDIFQAADMVQILGMLPDAERV